MTLRLSLRSFVVTALAATALGTMAPAMAHPNSHPRTTTCHLEENTSSNELVGYYPHGAQGGSRWVSLGQVTAAIQNGCGGVFSHSVRIGEVWVPLSTRIRLPSGTTDLWRGNDHLIVVPGRR